MDKLARLQWRCFCARLDPRKPYSKIWRIMRGLRQTPQQLHPFLAISLNKSISQLSVADAFCIRLTENSRPPSYERPDGITSSCTAMDEPFSIHELEIALKSSNHSSTPGPDGIRYSTLAHLGITARDKLLDIYNHAWSTGVVPSSWKRSRIVPLLKSGRPPIDLMSYRPIALSSCVGKTMERMILARLEWHLEKNNIYTNSMGGFRRGRSSVDNIIDLLTSVECEKRRRYVTTALFLDVKGAFDCIEHQAILNALSDIGVNGHLFDWINNYLQDRTIYVSTDMGDSAAHTVTRGVPQGGVLSPTLFNISLIGLAKLLPKSVRLSLYADDICVWTSSISQRYVSARLQKAANTILEYLEKRGLTISPRKSAAMSFTRKYVMKYPIFILGTPVAFVKQHTILGVTLDRSLTWSPHVKRLKRKLSIFVNMVKFVSGTRWGCSVASLLQLYNVLFVGLLRYSIPLLHGMSRSTLKELESIQAQALRVCLGLPRCASNIGTLAESRAISPGILRTQETIRVHLRHLTRHSRHHLSSVAKTRPGSSFSRVVQNAKPDLPSFFENASLPNSPPWLLSTIPVILDIPGVATKRSCAPSILRQISLDWTEKHHSSRVHVFTDASCSPQSSSIAVYAPSYSYKLHARLSHVTSSTAAELAAIRQAIKYISRQQPQDWTLFTDSRAALQSLQSRSPKIDSQQLVQDIIVIHHTAAASGHTVFLQWIPSHCGIEGNEAVDLAARRALYSSRIIPIPFSRSDAAKLVSNIGKELTSSLWANPSYHYAPLHKLDPLLNFQVPRGLPRRVEGVLHRLRLNVAFTKSYLFQIRNVGTPHCLHCNVLEDREHLLCHCPLYAKDRCDLVQTIGLSTGVITIGDVLGPWTTSQLARKATTSLLAFLTATKLIYVL